MELIKNLPTVVAALTFIAVIIAIATERLHLTVAAFLGSLILVFAHILTLTEAFQYISESYSTLALFFGIMVLVRSFEPTKIFDYLATEIVFLARGEGKRLLLLIVAITVPICAILPNATTVMLLGPLIPTIAEEIGIDFVPLLVLLVIVANSAGLLTIVGDPATFLVGDAVNISFIDYLLKLSFAGVIAILAVLLTIPILFRKIWRTKLSQSNFKKLPHPQINHPRVLILGGLIVFLVLVFFIIGELLPVPISPATVALLGAALALLLADRSKIDSVNNILRDVDWSTLLFFACTFVLIGGLEKTGAIDLLSGFLAVVLGQNIILGTFIILFLVGLLSSFLPNITLVVAMLPLLKQYLVNVGFVSESVLSPGFEGQLPAEILPLFYAMMFGATLGGNATLMGASSNIVAAGIAELNGKSISFKTFSSYGIPITILQLSVAAFYLLFAFFV
ncbi:MAG: SLC13 family permease [Prochloraceae cyanobacterium]